MLWAYKFIKGGQCFPSHLCLFQPSHSRTASTGFAQKVWSGKFFLFCPFTGDHLVGVEGLPAPLQMGKVREGMQHGARSGEGQADKAWETGQQDRPPSHKLPQGLALPERPDAFKITCLYAFHMAWAFPWALLISIFRAKSAADEGTPALRYKERTILLLSRFIIKFLWPCGLFSNIQVICSGVFLNRGCFSPFQKMSTDGDGFFKCWHPCLRKCSHLLCAEQVRQTNMMIRSSVSCRHAELIDRGKFNRNHTFFQCLQFLNDVYLLDISSGRNFI